MKFRLDQSMTVRGLVPTRSQAENWIRLGKVSVDGKVQTKPGFFVDEHARITIEASERYVSRAGLKLASIADTFGLDFEQKNVLDVGSSTGGFTDYALQHGACHVDAVDVGTDQLHPSLRGNERISLYEKTDIRHFTPDCVPDIVVIDVSFVSLRQILPHVHDISGKQTIILAMVKPQFEAVRHQLSSSGVIKNDTIRRQVLRDFETWAKSLFTVRSKADSEVRGKHGNHERFYFLSRLK